MPNFRPLSETKFINDANLKAYFQLQSDGTEYFGSGALSTTGAGGVSYTAAKYGNGLSVSNSGEANNNKYILGSDAKYGVTNGTDFTYSVIFKKGGTLTTEGHIFALNNSTSSVNISLHIHGAAELENKLSVDLDTTGTRQWTSTNTVFTDTTDFRNITITGTWGSVGTTLKVYINGGLIPGSWNLSTGVTPGAGKELQLGGRCGNSANDYGVNGIIDDFAYFNRILTPSEVNELYQDQRMTLGEYLPNSNTKLLLHLNGNSTDSSGNNNNGTDTNITYSQANGRFGMGAGFNGSSSKITNFPSKISPVGSRTISLFFKTNTLARRGIMETRAAYGSNGFVFNITAEGGFTYFHTGGSTAYVSSVISTNTLYHVVLTYDVPSATVKIYLNSKLILTQTSFSAETNSSFNGIIGNEQDNPGVEWFDGFMDEIIIENRAWSAEKVKKYYTMAKGRFGIL